MGTVPIYITEGFIMYRAEANKPARAELNCIFTIRNKTRAITAEEIVLTMVPANPVRNRKSFITNGNSIIWVNGSQTVPSCARPGIIESKIILAITRCDIASP